MRKKMRASVVAMVFLGALFVPAAPAVADLPATQYEPISLNGMVSPGYALSEPDGGVTVGCSGGANATQRINAVGNMTHNLPNSGSFPNTCARNAAVGKDGTLYTVVMNGMNNFTSIQAVKEGVTRWTYEFGCRAAVRGMVMGTNGNLYVLWSGLWPCGGMNKLVGLAPDPVNGAPNVVINVGMAAVLTEGGLAAYNDGLVLRTTGGVQYVGYDGQFGAGYAVSDGLSIGYAEYADATVQGRVVVGIRANTANTPPCIADTSVLRQVSAIGPNGGAWSYASFRSCSRLQAIRPTPQGGAIVHYDSPTAEVTPNKRQHFILAIDADGNKLWESMVWTPLTTADNNAPQSMRVDLHGNVALQQWLWRNNGTSAYKVLKLMVLSGFSGISLGDYELGPDANGYGFHTFADAPMGRNTWYVPAFRCWYNSCKPEEIKLYAVKVPGLGMDYPRGAILSPSVPVRNYVALGDSFSSGEGVPEFEDGTDTAGPPENRCRRSHKAYPRLLAAMPGINLTFAGFVACSGATISEIRSGEAPQLGALSSRVALVTLTAGGNDVPFKEFVTACLFTDCSNSSVKDAFFAKLQGITGQLKDLYVGPNSIRSQAPNAQVYAIGYPQLLPESGCTQTDGWMSALNALVADAHGGNPISINLVLEIGRAAELSDSTILAFIQSGVMEFNSAEVSTARSLVVGLNQAIKDAVQQVNQPWLVYVDPLAETSPFRGHELCTAQPYFSGLTVNPLNLAHDLPYSYHPNAKGQDAYRNLILQAIQEQ